MLLLVLLSSYLPLIIDRSDTGTNAIKTPALRTQLTLSIVPTRYSFSPNKVNKFTQRGLRRDFLNTITSGVYFKKSDI